MVITMIVKSSLKKVHSKSFLQAPVPVAPHRPQHFPPVNGQRWHREVGHSGQCRGSPEVAGVGHTMFQAKHSTSDESRVMVRLWMLIYLAKLEEKAAESMSFLDLMNSTMVNVQLKH